MIRSDARAARPTTAEGKGVSGSKQIKEGPLWLRRRGGPGVGTGASEGRGKEGASGRSFRTPGIRARGRKGEQLASPRDRRRLRERDVAERARVEQMLASTPVGLDRRTTERSSWARIEESQLRALGVSTGCPVCGDPRVVTDEVMHGGTLSMSECLHCDHRWTNRPRARWAELGARMTGGPTRRAHVTA